MRKLFTLFLIALLAMSINAVPVDVKQARSVAFNFLRSNFAQTKASMSELYLVWSDGGSVTRADGLASDATFYVFNLTDGGGFIVVSGDDALFPILGYGTQHTFKKESIPSNILNWFDGYKRQITWLRENKYKTPDTIVSAWQNLRSGNMQLKSGSKQLTTALWDQITPFNDLSPIIDGQETPAGCVATSLSIVMKYNQWPDVGEGSHSYTTYTYGLNLSATFNTPYDWNSMPLIYVDGQYTRQQAQNVATLMYDCGVLSDMDYVPGFSGALTLIAAQGLVDFMKYDKSLQVLSRDSYQATDWHTIIKAEIDKNRPVIYAGENEKREGHQFVIDGYNEDNYYHANWGWGGLANGFYLLSALEPDFQGTGGSSGGSYSFNQDAMIGIKKAEEGSSYQDVLYFFTETKGDIEFKGLSSSTTDVRQGVRFSVETGTVTSFCIREFNGLISLALVDKEGKVKEFISDQLPLSLGILNGMSDTLPCMITTTIDPADRIRLMYKSDDSNDWKWVIGGSTGITSEILVNTTTTSTEPINQHASVSVTYDRQGVATIHSSFRIEEVALYSIHGRLLKKLPHLMGSSVVLSYNEYPAGIYVIRVLDEKGSSSHKLIKD